MTEATKKTWFEKVSWLPKTTIYFALATILLSAAAVFGHTAGLWSFQPALLAFALAGALGLIGGLLGAIAIAVERKAAASRNAWKTIVATLICLFIGGNFVGFVSKGASVPPIHDVTTNLADIPKFVTLSPDNPNPDNWLELHEGGYGDLSTVTVVMPKAAALVKAKEVAEGFGWENVTVDASAGIIEATAVSSWFEFRDDIIIRIRENAGSSDIDMRSVSRVGVSDIGANAKRIKAFMAAMTD